MRPMLYTIRGRAAYLGLGYGGDEGFLSVPEGP